MNPFLSHIFLVATTAILFCNFHFCLARHLPPVATSLEKSVDLNNYTEDGLEITGLHRVKRGAAYPGGHGDFSGVAKQSTFAALGSYGGFLGHGKGDVSGGYNAGSGGYDGAGGITIAGALGSYGGISGHGGPTVISSGGYGNGGLLFGKI